MNTRFGGRASPGGVIPPAGWDASLSWPLGPWGGVFAKPTIRPRETASSNDPPERSRTSRRPMAGCFDLRREKAATKAAKPIAQPKRTARAASATRDHPIPWSELAVKTKVFMLASPSCQQPLYHMPMYIRQPVSAPLELVRQPLMVDPQQMHQGGVEVMDMQPVFHGVIAKLIRLAID